MTDTGVSRSYATYICTMGCTANCPCEVRATDLLWDDDGRAYPPPVNPETVIEEGLPCLVFRSDAAHPHPPKHIAAGEDGVLHEWADGDTACTLVQPCPGCGSGSCGGATPLGGGND